MKTESESIAAFLNYLRDAESRYHIEHANEQEANAKTQDILHRIELHSDSYHETARLGKLLRHVRQERRAAKDAADALAPIVAWVRANSSVTGMLERLLGEVRKIERRQEIREYIPRTDVLEVRNDD